MIAAKQTYRGDRRNAARSAGTLNKWRTKPRVRSGDKGTRTVKVRDPSKPEGFRFETIFVFTYLVAA